MKFRVLVSVMSCRDQVCIEFAKLWSENEWARIIFLLKKEKKTYESFSKGRRGRL